MRRNKEDKETERRAQADKRLDWVQRAEPAETQMEVCCGAPDLHLRLLNQTSRQLGRLNKALSKTALLQAQHNSVWTRVWFCNHYCLIVSMQENFTSFTEYTRWIKEKSKHDIRLV